MQKTQATKQSDIKREWHLYDLSGKILGRAATEIAGLLRGKSKGYFVHNLDCGDYVVIINAKKVKVTGNKANKKIYTRYSGYPGGLRTEAYSDYLKDHPERIIQSAVSGMLPNNKIKDQLLKRLYVYPDENFPFRSKFAK